MAQTSPTTQKRINITIQRLTKADQQEVRDKTRKLLLKKEKKQDMVLQVVFEFMIQRKIAKYRDQLERKLARATEAANMGGGYLFSPMGVASRGVDGVGAVLDDLDLLRRAIEFPNPNLIPPEESKVEIKYNPGAFDLFFATKSPLSEWLARYDMNEQTDQEEESKNQNNKKC